MKIPDLNHSEGGSKVESVQAVGYCEVYNGLKMLSKYGGRVGWLSVVVKCDL